VRADYRPMSQGSLFPLEERAACLPTGLGKRVWGQASGIEKNAQRGGRPVSKRQQVAQRISERSSIRCQQRD